MADPDLYALLGLDRGAEPDAIRSAYRTRVKELHPDLNPEADPEEFQRVDTAYKTLRDPERRQRYDDTGEIDSAGVDKERHDVLKLIVGAFESTLANGLQHDQHVSIVPLLRKAISQRVKEYRESLANSEREVAALVGLRDTITRKDRGENLFANVLDDHIRRHRREGEELRHAVAVGERAAEELELYDSFPRVVEAVQMQIWQYGDGTTTATST